jgi:hypothetical protein
MVEARNVTAQTIDAGINVENFTNELESVEDLLGWEIGKQIAEKEAEQIVKGLEQNHGFDVNTRETELSLDDMSAAYVKLAQTPFPPNTVLLNPLDLVNVEPSPRLRPRWFIERAGTKVTRHFEGILDRTMIVYFQPQIKDAVYLFDRSNVVLYRSVPQLSFDNPSAPTKIFSKSYCISSPYDPQTVAKITIERKTRSEF